MKIALSKTFTHNGVNYNEFDLALENLTGQDLIDAEENLRRAGIVINGAADFSRNYLLAVAAKVLKLPRESLLSLPAKDFTRIINETLIFLAGAALESVSPESAME
ncbi:MAG: phage tail assembly protein [Synergistaceae bacterium]|nr:phage tail assembly protein [Synergistaceae bacterium]